MLECRVVVLRVHTPSVCPSRTRGGGPMRCDPNRTLNGNPFCCRLTIASLEGAARTGAIARRHPSTWLRHRLAGAELSLILQLQGTLRTLSVGVRNAPFTVPEVVVHRLPCNSGAP